MTLAFFHGFHGHGGDGLPFLFFGLLTLAILLMATRGRETK